MPRSHLEQLLYIEQLNARRHKRHENDNTSNNHETNMINIPKYLKQSTFLPISKTITILMTEYNITHQNIDLLLSIISGQENSSFLNMKSTINVHPFIPTNTISTTTKIPKKKIEIIQLVFDNRSQYGYLLSNEGIVSIVDMHSYDVILSSRVLWSEGLLTRNFENEEQFLKWQKHYTTPDSNSTTSNKNKWEAMIKVSQGLSHFLSTLASHGGLNKILFIDPQTGALIINCSIIHRSICFYNPASLKRLYRIRAPGSLGDELTDMIQDISCGHDSYNPRFQSVSKTHCTGAISDMIILSMKSIIICSLINSTNLFLINMISGELLIELNGHTSFVTTIAYNPDQMSILSGSLNGHIRVWSLNDFIPSNLAKQSTNTQFESHLENTIMNSTKLGIGNSSRQAARVLWAQLCTCLKIKSCWRKAKIMSYTDGNITFSTLPRTSPSQFAVEVSAFLLKLLLQPSF